MVTVKSAPWHVGGRALVLGDAAHAIVPFFGQGMNCAFEDCEVLLGLFDRHGGNWEEIFPRFFAERKPNTDAIAQLALDNFVEMRDTSADPHFALKRRLEHVLEERYPGQFFSKYAMVTFHRFPYREFEKGLLTTLSDAERAAYFDGNLDSPGAWSATSPEARLRCASDRVGWRRHDDC